MDKTMTISRRAAVAALGGCALAAYGSAQATRTTSLVLRARSRAEDGSRIAVREQTLHWKPAETAIIICDMWDNHYCQNAAKRVAAMAPDMNRVIKAARDLGITIIHAPSGTMDVYAGTPQ